MGLEFVLSQKNTSLLCSKGFLYAKTSQSGNKICWRCIHYPRDKCRGRAHTTSTEPDGVLLWESELEDHNHPPQPEVVAVKKKISELKARARQSDQNTGELVAEVIATTSADVAAELPRRQCLNRTMQRVRQHKKPDTDEIEREEKNNEIIE